MASTENEKEDGGSGGDEVSEEHLNNSNSTGAETSHSPSPPKLKYAVLSEKARENIQHKKEEFEKFPTRQDQVEHILECYGIKEVPASEFMYFEREIMCEPEPAPVDFRRQGGESNDQYHARVKAYFERITEFTVTQMYGRDGNHCLSVLSAPSSEPDPWGFSHMSKQQDLSASHHLFRRVGSLETERVTRTMHDLMRERRMVSVLWLGASGIGNSLSLVDILVRLVRELVPGRYVGFHRGGALTVYGKDKSGALKKRTKSLDFIELKKIHANELKDDIIMLVDPPEIVGEYEQFCPTLIALSARLEENDLKGFRKGAVWNLVVDPLCQSEVEAVATCVGAVDSDITYAEIMERYETLGSNLRVILAPIEAQYETQKSDIETTKAHHLIKEAKVVNPMSVPKHFKFFVVPYNNPNHQHQGQDRGGCEIFNNARRAIFHPWSDFTAQKLRDLAEKDTQLKLMKSLEDIGLPYVVEENAIQSSLLQDETTDWEWYENTANRARVNKPATNPPTLSVQRVVRFEGRYFRAQLSTLRERTLYKSSGWQMVLGDFFVVQEKAEGSGRIVYMIQVSSRDPQEHPFKVDQYQQWRTSLQMGDADDMIIIYTTNTKHTQLHGLRFQDQDGNDVVSPCDDYIVRTPMTPGADRNRLAITDDDAGWASIDPATKGFGADWVVQWKPLGSKNKRYRLTSPNGDDFRTLAAAKKSTPE